MSEPMGCRLVTVTSSIPATTEGSQIWNQTNPATSSRTREPTRPISHMLQLKTSDRISDKEKLQVSFGSSVHKETLYQETL